MTVETDAPVRRCYACDVLPARYQAVLAWSCAPQVLLCDDCAIWERATDSVVSIRTLEVSR